MKYTIETEEKEDAAILIGAHDNYNILFELKHNFARKWKHADVVDGRDVLNSLSDILDEFRP